MNQRDGIAFFGSAIAWLLVIAAMAGALGLAIRAIRFLLGVAW